MGGGQLDGLRGPVQAGAGVPRGQMLWEVARGKTSEKESWGLFSG